MTDTTTTATKPAKRPGPKGKYRPEFCEQVRELGKTGHTILTTAAKLGVSHAALISWEKKKPEFREAFERVRENSRKMASLRMQKQFAKTETRLILNLERIRALRAKNMEKVKAIEAELAVSYGVNTKATRAIAS